MRTRWLIGLLGTGLAVAFLSPIDTPALATTTLTVPSQFPTIQAALNAASPGDTVSVSPGTYSENINFNSQDVTVASTGGASQTTIEAPGGTAVTIGPAGSITGFTISGGTAAFGAGMAVSGAGTVIANDIFQSNSEGSGGFGAAIGGNGASPVIEQDLFVGNSCDDQFTSGVVAFVNDSSPTIENNVFHDNTCRAINLSLPQDPTPLVINNTIVRNSTGIRIDGRVISTGEVVRNNIVTDNGTGLEVDFGNGPTWDHNLVFDNTQNYSGIADQTGMNGNLSADPLFVDSSSDNFQLLPASPAIGAGSAVGAPTVDFNGNPRPQGTIDMGAFQSVSAAAQLADLAQTVTGVGPGTSLAKKVARAQSDLAAGKTAKACRTLGAFTKEVRAQSGKSITPSTAQQLIADAKSIQTALAC
jgi:serine protease